MSKLSQFRKAIAPAVLGVAAVIAQWIGTGTLGEAELRTALAALFVSVVVYFVPNEDATYVEVDLHGHPDIEPA